MRIDDQTGTFNQAELEDLTNFVSETLYSTESEREWLDAIRIREDVRSGNLGIWTFKARKNRFDATIDIVAVIILNYYYVKLLPPAERLQELKKVLAHEYGHHWTLSYLVVNQDIDIWTEPLPAEYYSIRGLNHQVHTHNYSKGWHYCDKEIIAEDYRVLLVAEPPYNQNHRMAGDGLLPLPLPDVADYIQNLNSL